MKKPKKKPKLIPVDLNQCQSKKPNGYSFVALGGRPGLVRCENKPTLIAYEILPGKDRLKGSMSLCSGCFCVLAQQEGLTNIRTEKIR